jgi:hypothetical protein
MNVLDLYTRHGDRLSFLCNTHMLIEGRRKAIKLGFLAQLIEYDNELKIKTKTLNSFFLVHRYNMNVLCMQINKILND